jgi:hypothetical protein
MDATLADLLCRQGKYVEAENIDMQVLRRCGDVDVSRLAAMVLSRLFHAQGRLEEALEAIKMVSELNARMQCPDDKVTKECERKFKEITQEIGQLRKPWGGDFASMNSPQRGLNEVAGHMGSDLDLLGNKRVLTLPNSWL